MAECRITAIRKPNRFSAHEHITHLGNPEAGWIWTREEVIRDIEQKFDTFFVLDPSTGKRSLVALRL